MKVTYRHQLKIHTSRVIEILSLMSVLSRPEYHESVLELHGFSDIKRQFQKELKLLAEFETFQFSWLEFMLIISEREHIDLFFDDILKLDKPKQLQYFFGSLITFEEAQSAAQDITEFSKQLQLLNMSPSHAAIEALWHFDDWTNRFKTLAIDLSSHAEFNRQLNTPEYSTLSEALCLQFKQGMLDRHPLSYAQELMGKPFWNIADYKHYEFIPVHFISPYKMRLMDSDTMIYVHSLHRTPNTELATAEGLAEVLKLLSDPNRLKILQMLYMKPMYGKEVAEVLGLTTATVSHHLENLRQKGLVQVEQSKQIKYFSANLPKVRTLLQAVEQFVKTK